MTTKSTFIESDDKKLSIRVIVHKDESDTPDVYVIELPFSVVPPQIAHQIASQLAMCNSYYVEDAESGTKVADNR